MASLSIKVVSVLTAVRQFSVAKTDGLTVYQSNVLTALRQFSVAETDSLTVYQSVLTAGRYFSVYPSFLTAS